MVKQKPATGTVSSVAELAFRHLSARVVPYLDRVAVIQISLMIVCGVREARYAYVNAHGKVETDFCIRPYSSQNLYIWPIRVRISALI